jgi:hypothetical protein
MRAFGRALQLLGLTLPILGIALQLGGAASVGTMLTMLVAAVAAFWLGRIMEGYAR